MKKQIYNFIDGHTIMHLSCPRSFFNKLVT